MAEPHPFLRAKITPAMSRNQLMTLLADFRAKGRRPKAPRPVKKVSTTSGRSSLLLFSVLQVRTGQLGSGGQLSSSLDFVQISSRSSKVK